MHLNTSVYKIVCFALCLVWTVAGCGAGQHPQAAPCLSDRECHNDRICHQGHCRFYEDVLKERNQPHKSTARVEAPVKETPQETAAFATESVFMGDAQHTGRSAHKGPAQEPKILWRYATGARIYSAPVTGADGTLFVASLDNTLTAVSAEGALRWRYAEQTKLYASPVVQPKTVIGAGLQGTVFAINTTGVLLWRRFVAGEVAASLTMDAQGLIYVAAQGLHAFDVQGNLVWQRPHSSSLQSAPAIHPRGWVICGTSEGEVLAIRHGGEIEWSSSLGSPVNGGISIRDDGVILVGTDAGEIVALDATGKILWRYKTEGKVRATPAVAKDGTAIVGSYDRSVYALNADGTLRWKFATQGRIRASARIDAEQRIYVGSQDDWLVALSMDGTLIWRTNLAHDIDSTATLARGTLYVGTDDGAIYALR